MRGYQPTSQHPSDEVAQFARAVSSSVSGETGAVLLNVEGIAGLDGAEDGKGEGSHGVEFYGALGVVGRPLPPDQVGGAARHMEVLCVRTSDALVPFAVRDVRLNQALPNLKPGDLAFSGYGSNFLKLAADGGAYLVTTTDSTPNGQLVQLQHRPDGLAYVAPWGKLTYDQGGLHVLHHTGARLDLGGVGGLPAPISALGNYVTLSAALIRLQCASLTVGPDAGLPDNAVKATPLEALLAAVAAAATAASATESATAAAIAALAAIPGNVAATEAAHAAVSASAASVAALTSVAAAIGAALPPVSPTTIRSQSLVVT